MADAEFDIRNQQFEKCDQRAWEAPDQIFVSFCFDCCDSEDTAIRLFGHGNYDVYRLERKSEK